MKVHQFAKQLFFSCQKCSDYWKNTVEITPMSEMVHPVINNDGADYNFSMTMNASGVSMVNNDGKGLRVITQNN